jgi:hypothetical protein
VLRPSTTPAESEGARREVVAALLDDLDVPATLAIAKEAGGRVLTEVIDFLGLRDTTTWY